MLVSVSVSLPAVEFWTVEVLGFLPLLSSYSLLTFCEVRLVCAVMPGLWFSLLHNPMLLLATAQYCGVENRGLVCAPYYQFMSAILLRSDNPGHLSSENYCGRAPYRATLFLRAPGGHLPSDLLPVDHGLNSYPRYPVCFCSVPASGSSLA